MFGLGFEQTGARLYRDCPKMAVQFSEEGWKLMG